MAGALVEHVGPVGVAWTERAHGTLR